jgi:quercetin dioxygenase-like cupin family protein
MKLLVALLFAAAVNNDRVMVTEDRLGPGETRAIPGTPALTVYLTDGKIGNHNVHRGEVVSEPAQSHTIKNSGSTEMKLVRVEFRNPPSSETWGPTGLSPNYKVLLENRYTRVYDIRIPAGTREPQHTHHDRVVVCLSGAELEHLMPDGRIEPSTLKTGEIAWRKGGTHIGHNLGKTDLWVIAIEPK